MPLGELETFLFKGQKRYRCPECAFDNHDPHAVAKHWVQSHTESQGPATGSTLFDASDKPIENEREIILPWADPFR